MIWLRIICAAILALSTHASQQQGSAPAPASQLFPSGVITPKVVCVDQPAQSYALYLPSDYDPAKKWPVVYIFDPLARGIMPVQLMKDAAERYGYILASSNNARNGPWVPLAAAAQAVMQDTQYRLSIDTRQVYFAGLSGTARFASSLEQSCQCAAGVLLDGAGFAPDSPPAAGDAFPVFLAVGDLDFNYPEVVELDAKLETLHYSHALQKFEGPHEWAPADVLGGGFAWFRLIAMKQGRERLDAIFVKAQAEAAEKRAESLARSGDAYRACQEFRQDAETFERLGGNFDFRRRAAALEKKKSVREGAQREQQDFAEQAQLTSQISSGLEALRRQSIGLTASTSGLQQQISALQNRAAHRKNPRELRVYRRALSGVGMEATEDGIERFHAKDYLRARAYFELASAADPDSPAPLQDEAEACALQGDTKSAIQALLSAKQKSKDAAAFVVWLEKTSAFDKIRDAPEFRTLLATSQDR